MARSYWIRVKGHLDPQWSEWPAALVVVNHPDGEATLRGPLRDQAELLGLLLRLHDFNTTLLALDSQAIGDVE
jgi:hypothetical protein